MAENRAELSRGDANPQTLIQKILSHRNAMTLKQFAEIFSIAYKTAFEMATHARIPAIQVGSCWRIDPAAIVVWLQERQLEGEARSSRYTSHQTLSTQERMMTLPSQESHPETIIERLAKRQNALKLPDFAELFSISYKTAFELATHGNIPAFQVGAAWRIDPYVLSAWVERNQTGARSRIPGRSLTERPPTINPRCASNQRGQHPPDPSPSQKIAASESSQLEMISNDRRIANKETLRTRDERGRTVIHEKRVEHQGISRNRATNKRANAESGEYTGGRRYRYWIPDRKP